MNKYITINEVAYRCGVSLPTVRRWMKRWEVKELTPANVAEMLRDARQEKLLLVAGQQEQAAKMLTWISDLEKEL